MTTNGTTKRGRGRPRTGSVFSHDDHLDIRITHPDGTRSAPVCLPRGTSRAKAQEAAAAMTEASIADFVSKSGAAKVGKATPTPALAERLEEWVARWCADRRARGLSSVKDDEGRLRKWVLPRLDPPLGKRPADSLTSLDLEQLVEDLDQRVRDGELSWKTAKNTWGNVTKLCDDMVRAKTATLRIRKDNPSGAALSR